MDTLDSPLHLEWQRADGPTEYWYGSTQTRFSAQIGVATDSAGYSWVIFHSDFRGAVWGDVTKTVEMAKVAAQEYLRAQAKQQSDTEPGDAA